MNPFEMVVLIVGISAVASVLRAKYGVVRRGRGRHATEEFVGRNDPENERLKSEITALKDRIAVLERLATDNHSAVALDREIEKLR
jgi:hypothetical protein